MQLKRASRYNPKRRLRPSSETPGEREYLERLAGQIGYGGNPEHKKNPGDFGLSVCFAIDPCWEPSGHGSEEVRQTTAALRIVINDQLVTRVDNDWSRSVQETVRLSAYPLALWLAASWWRLNWEPTPNPDNLNTAWRMAHEMGGAGEGYLWPPLQFETDGERVTVHCAPSKPTPAEPIRYLNPMRESLPVQEFAKGVEAFIDTVLARLEAVGVRHTELHTLWGEVNKERGNPEFASFRKMEAMLGFEPDEMPDSVAQTLEQVTAQAGEGAGAEIAAACAAQPAEWLADVLQQAQAVGVSGTLNGIAAMKKSLKRELAPQSRRGVAPWDRGRNLARALRVSMGFGSAPVTDDQLGSVLGLSARYLAQGESPVTARHLSLAIKKEGLGDRISCLFRRGSRLRRRFEVARWVADALTASSGDDWFPSTEANTVRQKEQRAFAAELLVPIEALQEFLGKDLTDEERIEEAGGYFDVSLKTVQSHLTNHGLVPRSIWFPAR
ncbi:MAG: hypothetical protein HQL64_07455 [Magnetococcales bacterium]|nr:hypothetical protein [Magnetococcales bacterium]